MVGISAFLRKPVADLSINMDKFMKNLVKGYAKGCGNFVPKAVP